MGNASNFCCDHNAQMKLFQSKFQALSHKDYQEFQKDLKAATRQRNNIFQKDDTSIIDQFQLKSEIIKNSQLGQIKPGSSTNLTLKQKDYNSEQLLTSQTLRWTEKQWPEYRMKELEKEKQNQTKIIRQELMKELQPSQSIRKRPLSSFNKEEKKSKTNKKFDFQFVVNYHR